MTTTTVENATLYMDNGYEISKLYSMATAGSDLTPTDDFSNWVPHLWIDQTYGLLVDLTKRTISLIQPTTLRRWRLDGVIQ